MTKHDHPGRTHFAGDECPGGHIEPLTDEEIRRYNALAPIARELAASGVQLDDPRMDYLVIQVDRETWDALQAWRRDDAEVEEEEQ